MALAILDAMTTGWTVLEKAEEEGDTAANHLGVLAAFWVQHDPYSDLTVTRADVAQFR